MAPPSSITTLVFDIDDTLYDVGTGEISCFTMAGTRKNGN